MRTRDHANLSDLELRALINQSYEQEHGTPPPRDYWLGDREYHEEVEQRYAQRSIENKQRRLARADKTRLNNESGEQPEQGASIMGKAKKEKGEKKASVRHPKLEAGMEFVREYKDKKFTLRIEAGEEGALLFKVGSKSYDSVSSAATGVTGGAANGWVFWKIAETLKAEKKSEREGEKESAAA